MEDNTILKSNRRPLTHNASENYRVRRKSDLQTTHTSAHPIERESKGDVEHNPEHYWSLFCTSQQILQGHLLQSSYHCER